MVYANEPQLFVFIRNIYANLVHTHLTQYSAVAIGDDFFQWQARITGAPEISFQVWSLTYLFLYAFYVKSLICLEGKSMALIRYGTKVIQIPGICKNT